MAAYTITAAEVLPRTNTQTKLVIAGEAVTAGQSVYEKPADGRYWLCQADGNADECKFKGIALGAAAAGQPFVLAYDGEVQLDSTTLTNAAVGDLVVLGPTAGALHPSGDLSSTNRVTLCGYIKQMTPCVLVLHSLQTGVAKA